MKHSIYFILTAFLTVLPSLSALAEEPPAPEAGIASKEPKESHSFAHSLLWYVPNRLLDVLDIFRLRARVGPGFAVGARATKVAQAYVGSYASVYAGLPGPRNRQLPKSPVGIESYSGVALSLAEATTGAGFDPDYSPTEFEVSAHLALIGIDFGIDPVEIGDFALGIIGLDLKEDDI